jgi:hypothetical protein
MRAIYHSRFAATYDLAWNATLQRLRGAHSEQVLVRARSMCNSTVVLDTLETASIDAQNFFAAFDLLSLIFRLSVAGKP